MENNELIMNCKYIQINTQLQILSWNCGKQQHQHTHWKETLNDETGRLVQRNHT